MVGADLYLHRKHGVNAWGYRGPSVGKKHPGEKRVAVLGGSTTWGFGLRAGQDFPAQLQELMAKDERGATIKILNLGSNAEGASSFVQTLRDYEYLEADLDIFYSGYNDLSGPNYFNFRHRSPVFALTGYLPLLPSLTVDKLSVWKERIASRNERVIFEPPHLAQPGNPTMSRPGVKPEEPGLDPELAGAGKCSPRWQFYCEQIAGAAEFALARGKRILIVGEPYINDDHVSQQQELERMLAVRFAREPRLRYINLGRVVDLGDQSLCWDGMHLTPEGNRRIAAALEKPTVETLHQVHFGEAAPASRP